METYVELAVQAGSLLAALVYGYNRLSKKLEAQTKEIKTHTDVSINRMNGTLAAVVHSFDRPCWIKMAVTDRAGNVEFRMLELNSLYERAYKVRREDYIGKTDAEVGWPKETARGFYEHDVMVWSSGEAQTVEERIDGRLVRFRRLRLISRDGLVKGVLGYQVDCIDPQNCPFHTKKKEA